VIAALALLGAYHGINPAMGWLFAVALGLQEGRRRAVLWALPPIALGHLISVGVVAALVGVGQLALPPAPLRLVGAGAVIAFGCYKLVRPRSHPRWVGMRVGAHDLVLWSFLMSSAHGAGLMLVPVLLGPGAAASAHALHGHDTARLASETLGLSQASLAALVHTTAMLAAMAVVAVLVYDRLGVGFLRKAWINTDVAWALSLVGAGALTLAL
jgi:hypothetical protein